LLGGTLHIQSLPGHGTTVQALLPLPSVASGEAKDV
jgi:chemotaxis protein histidine kinase CheA